MNEALLTARAAALERIKALLLDSLPSPESKRADRHSLDDFFRWCDVEGVGAFTEAAMTEVASAISRVRGAKQIGVRCGQWLTREQAENLLSVPDVTAVKGKRDRALLAVLLGCGLRRSEASKLTTEHVQLREARRAIVDLIGKGQRVRTVPMPSWTKSAIDDWFQAAGTSEGLIFRSVDRGGHSTGKSMTARAIFEVAQGCGQKIGVPELAPHDLRRTFAKLAHKGRAGLEQIQLALVRVLIATNEP